MNRTLEKCCFNGIDTFCRITIRVCASWCIITARYAIIWANGRATSETAGKTANDPACRTASEAASGVISAAANSANYKVTSKAAGKIPSRTIDGVADRIGTIRV